MSNSDHIGELIFLHLRDELKPEQKPVLEEWRAASIKNEETFQELIDPENLKSMLRTYHVNKAEIWRRIIEKCPELAPGRSKEHKSFP